ncbi:MAG: GNAT family N-acetyltransferase [Candidatus Thermoplasmatota archaeon]|nr:GNAT family N-acetyltransferase [Candidatus Thermoplasmatota archaeon]
MPIRNLRIDDIDFVLDLVLKEGWSYHRVELERMLDMDPEGSFIYEETEPLGFITTVTYLRTGVIGHLIVSEHARGKRIGQTLVDRALQYTSERGTESVLLYATEEGAEMYRKLGFRTLAEVFCIRAEKSGPMVPQEYPGLSPVKEGDLGRISQMDAALFGDDRSGLISRLWRDYPDLCFKIERSGEIQGYSFGRATSSANDLGPWVCVSGLESDERALFDSVVSRLDDRGVFMGIFVQNENALRQASKLRPIRTWRTHLMARGHARYTGRTEHVLGLVGFELG